MGETTFCTGDAGCTELYYSQSGEVEVLQCPAPDSDPNCPSTVWYYPDGAYNYNGGACS
jgi:hypothetical protein